MVVVASARPPGTDLSLPPNEILGWLLVNNTTGNSTADIWASVNADLAPLINPTGIISVYRVDWNARYTISAPPNANISRFFSNPQRLNYGNVTYGTQISISAIENLNFTTQTLRKSSFLYSPTTGRLVDEVLDYSGVALATSFFVGKDYLTAPLIFASAIYPPHPYADVLRTALYSGISARIDINYRCVRLIASNGTLAFIPTGL